MSTRRNASRALRIGSVGGLLPLLTAAGASCIADRREALNAPTKSSKTPSDCLSTTAQMVYRGIGTGLAWTIGADGYFLASLPDAELRQLVAARPGSSVAWETARYLGRLSVLNMAGFAGFMGIFGGVSCSLEHLRGVDDLLNPFVGGFTAGLVFVPKESRKPRTLLLSALAWGTMSMALHYLIQAEKSESEGVTETR